MVSVKASSSGKVTVKIRIIVATLRIQQYYSSLKEGQYQLSENALTRLDRQDCIGFFKSGGPNYIRRAQEFTSIFKFTSTNTEVSASSSALFRCRHPTLSLGRRRCICRSRYEYHPRTKKSQLLISNSLLPVPV